MVELTSAQQFAAVWSSSAFPWEGTALLLTMIGFAAAAIAYMLARIFMSKEIEKWAKIEFMYALSTVVLVAFLIFIIDFMAVKATEFNLLVAADRPYLSQQIGEIRSPFDISNFYVLRMSDCVQTRYVQLMTVAAIPKALSTIETKATASTRIGSIGEALQPKGLIKGGIYSVVTNFAISTTYTLTYLIYSLAFQKHLLLFAQQVMLTIFLPMGVVLRAFPFTRGPGNLFIAIAIGFYFIYPLAYSLVLTFSAPVEQIEASCGLQSLDSQQRSDSQFLSSASNSDSPIFSGKVSILLIPFTTLYDWIANGATYAYELAATVTSIPSVLSELVMYAIFYPFVVAVITYTFIRSFAIFLGADAQDFAQGLVKLV